MKPITLALAMVCAVPVVSVPVFTAPASATVNWDWDIGGRAAPRPASSALRALTTSGAIERHYESPKVMAFVKREDETANAKDKKPRFDCADKVRGVGTQWIGTEGALDTAKKDWMERVRYDYGEFYLDMTNAKDFISRCGRTSIARSPGQVMYRCEIVARPCKAQEGSQAKVTDEMSRTKRPGRRPSACGSSGLAQGRAGCKIPCSALVRLDAGATAAKTPAAARQLIPRKASPSPPPSIADAAMI